MEIDTEKIDEAVLALLWLTLHDECRAWKGFDWEALDRLHGKDKWGKYFFAPSQSFLQRL